ncbi:hypothetical protein M9458_053116, partial [Cirrhinus mrigala]
EVDIESVEEAPLSLQYEELLEVVTRVVAKLKIDWPAESQTEPQKSKLDERFLRSRPHSARRSLPFFPDLHTEVSRSWSTPFSARLFIPASYNYGNVAGLDERSYRAMLRVEQMLASYLSPGSASSLKAPAPPSKPLRVTSALVYQADLLKELDEGDEIKDSDISELRRTADLSLRATKETAYAIGRSMAALVAAERHLWLTLSDMKEKDREAVLPTLPVLQGEAVSSEHPPRFLPPGNVAEPGSSPPPRGSSGPLVQVLPAGKPLQDTVLAAQPTPEASVERLVPLVDHLVAWKLLPNVSDWVPHTVGRGYRIQFGAPPTPFNRVSPTLVGPEQGLVMEQEVATLLRKEAIEVLLPHDRESGFYSQYFIVPKKDSGLRPILDLRLLNRSVSRLEFKMLTVKQVVSQIRSEDWFVMIDLKDAYFHVSILPQHRKFLRFAFRGEAYQYRVLPFGLGIHILNYIDDWLILAQLEHAVAQHRDVVLAHMKELGLRLNAKKIARVKEGRSLTVKQFQQLLGLMAAGSNVITLPPGPERPPRVLFRTDNTAVVSYINHQEESWVSSGPLSGPFFSGLCAWSGKSLFARPRYVPKVPSSAPRPVVLQAFCPPPFREPDQQKLNCMCPVRVLDTYVHRAAMWRKSDQLFVCYGPTKRGLPATKQTLSRWIMDAITRAYESSGLPPLLGVKAHSTRSIADSKAFLEGVSIQGICNAAGWSMPLTFVRFYDLDLRVSPGSSVLRPRSPSWRHGHLVPIAERRFELKFFVCVLLKKQSHLHIGCPRGLGPDLRSSMLFWASLWNLAPWVSTMF